MVYDAFRVNGGPTQHGPFFHAAHVDVVVAGFILGFCILGFSFVSILPGFRGIKRVYFLIRVVVSLFIGSAILLGVLGQEWEVSEIETKTPYKVFSRTEINATIGAKIGLGSINITLKGNPVQQLVDQTHLVTNNTFWTERIDYNERFHWAWRQGRFGFGPYSGRINQEFRQAQYKGLPIPILWVAEYFTLDGELIRWGRSFRTAGWYTWQVLWTAFPLWIISNALSVMVLSYCGLSFILTGALMLMSVIIYSTIRFGYQPLVIPFENATMEFIYGPAFWLTMTGGIVSVLYGSIIWFMDYVYPNQISNFFGIGSLKDSEQFFHEKKQSEDDHARSNAPRGGVARRVQARVTQLARRSRRRRPRADTPQHPNDQFDDLQHRVEEGEIYENVGDGVRQDIGSSVL